VEDTAVASTTLGTIIRRRRRQLELTQEEVARRIGVRANYIGYLERDLRRPSTGVLAKLGKVLDLDREEMFFLAHPQVRSFMHTAAPDPSKSAWDQFRTNTRLHHANGAQGLAARLIARTGAVDPRLPVRSASDPASAAG
jgi:transcriptional regulator with XRE-family HTH domain